MKRILLVIAFLNSIIAYSQTVISLDSVFSAIRNNHPSLRSSDALARSLDEAAKGAKSWDAPELGTGMWMTPYDPSLWKRQSNGATGMGQYIMSVQQMIPNRQAQAAGENYMRAMSSVEKYKKNTTINELYAAAKQSYYQWLIDKQKLRVLAENANLLDFMIKDAELKYKNNLGKINTYYKLKAALGEIEDQRIGLENEMDLKRISLNILMNRGPQQMFDIDTTFEILDFAAQMADSVALLNRRSDIGEVVQNIRITGLEQEAERAKLKPEFGLQYDHMFGFGGVPMQYTLMASVRLPMLSWSARSVRANVESLKWKAVALDRQRETLINEAIGESFSLEREMEGRRRQIGVIEHEVIPALQKNFQTTELAYEQNTDELFEVFDAWQSLNSTQLGYWDQVLQVLLIQVELERVQQIN